MKRSSVTHSQVEKSQGKYFMVLKNLIVSYIFWVILPGGGGVAPNRLSTSPGSERGHAAAALQSSPNPVSSFGGMKKVLILFSIYACEGDTYD
ncbi:hypothetical protein CEXT_341971 [Caerostris extrusa]|uniref:Uncharacterized protein n=1 Tax=Caerostris extrusa TaxID=172846 RepID=A0AAV4NLP5_CAEEX|nr:hypothetical protein CEXT_341971 [Caerostris extrusa]